MGIEMKRELYISVPQNVDAGHTEIVTGMATVEKQKNTSVDLDADEELKKDTMAQIVKVMVMIWMMT